MVFISCSAGWRGRRAADLAAGDVGGLDGDGPHPLERVMARTPRRLSRCWRRGGSGHRLVGELLQYDSRVRPIMKLHLIGVNHKTAPVEVRERLAIPDSHLPEAVRRLAEHPGVDEGLILSTCNRVEVLAQTKNGTVDLRSFLRDYFQLNPGEYEPHLYEYREGEAVRHLFRVTSSLDSMVVGEPQILGQVKEAYATARAVGAVHSQL